MKTASLLLFAVMLAPAPIFAAGGPAAETKPEPRTLSVTGEATVQIPTTHARITVAIDARDKTPDAAQAAITEKSNPLLDYLRQANVEKLQTSGLTLRPIFDYSSSKYSSMPESDRPITGYEASWVATFEVPIAQAGKIADAAVKKGATRIADFQLKATDEAVAKAKREALQQAARNAREDAAAVLGALNYEPKDVVRIQVNNSGPIIPMYRPNARMMAMSADKASAPTAIEGGMQDVNASVYLEIAY